MRMDEAEISALLDQADGFDAAYGASLRDLVEGLLEENAAMEAALEEAGITLSEAPATEEVPA